MIEHLLTFKIAEDGSARIVICDRAVYINDIRAISAGELLSLLKQALEKGKKK